MMESGKKGCFMERELRPCQMEQLIKENGLKENQMELAHVGMLMVLSIRVIGLMDILKDKESNCIKMDLNMRENGHMENHMDRE